ncbi:MAG TPA: hypothetical protein VHW23_16990 [Kofleriaceae bacterium]|jgi:hypothetical protein|nr:hypothetical protein [Kofleriaceae bacterium]
MTKYRQLFILSAILLFVELAVIRWTVANVLYLGYFSNFVMLGAFLGIGLGCLRAASARDLFPWFSALLLGFVAFVFAFHVDLRIETGDVVYFKSNTRSIALPLWVTVPVVFAFVTALFTALGQRLGAQLRGLPPLPAYTWNIAGSLLGIVAFTACSAFGLPPPVWFALVFIGLFALDGDAPKKLVRLGFAGAVVAVLLIEWLHGDVHWSPYYKIELNPTDDAKGLVVSVNGVGHQTMLPTDAKLAEHPFYLVPYTGVSREPQHYKKALVIGAGTGTDVAVALRQHVDHVDAVEIDPEIYTLGAARYPDPVPPLADPRVTRTITDGRAFLRNSTERYDLIIFALPDSLTLSTTMSNIRLESFLFTEEALRSARDHLDADGLLVLYNFYRQPMLVEKIAAMLARATGSDPCVVNYGGRGYLAIFMTGPRLQHLTCPTQKVGALGAWAAPGVEHGVSGTGVAASPIPSASDDWPFLYLAGPTISTVYLYAIALVLLVSLGGVAVLGQKGSLGRVEPEFFFLGMAFLLLEAKSVVQFELLFGATWLVNSLVFFAILVMVLIANLIVRFVRFDRPAVIYGLLVVALVLQFLFPLDQLLGLGAVARFAVASALTFGPVLVANLLFSRAFRDTAHPDRAFAWNLIGSMVGGTLEYTSLLLGYHKLMFIVAGLYALAGLFAMRRPRSAGALVP